ncbi:MAG: amylo-alpha-1,6-glucosidase, partial [Mesorhizobium sp.]
GDMAFVDSLWPSLCAAAEWTEEASRPTGFVTYQRAAESGLANQGWKDSHDSVFHADGRTPRGPIALVEVQGYAFAAFRGLAALARRRGEIDRADHWESSAEAMRAAVE